MFYKKNKLGMKERPRPVAEIEADYAREAQMAGHTGRLARELYEQSEAHLEAMSRLSKESVAAQADAKLAEVKEGPALNQAQVPIPAQVEAPQVSV